MESQIKEERERRASVLQADGEREAAVIRSAGNAAKASSQHNACLIHPDGAIGGGQQSCCLHQSEGRSGGEDPVPPLIRILHRHGVRAHPVASVANAEAKCLDLLRQHIVAGSGGVRAVDYLVAMQVRPRCAVCCSPFVVPWCSRSAGAVRCKTHRSYHGPQRNARCLWRH